MYVFFCICGIYPSHSNSSITQINLSMQQLRDAWHAILTTTLVSMDTSAIWGFTGRYPRVFYTYLSIPPGIRGLFQQSGGFLIAKYTCNALDKVQDQLLKNMLCHRKISFFLDNEV